jgi:hypothetical protein
MKTLLLLLVLVACVPRQQQPAPDRVPPGYAPAYPPLGKLLD